MNTNVLGGVAAFVGLAAILYFGHTIRTDINAARPQAPIAAPKAAPAPKTEPKKAVKAESKSIMIYHRVERGGAQGPEVACTSVTPFAEGKSPAELAALAKQYEVPVSKLKGYFVCTN